MRDAIAMLLAPAMKVTGFRFSKEYRHAKSGFKAFVYRNVNTIAANLKAGL
jgi:hypothetical protein